MEEVVGSSVFMVFPCLTQMLARPGLTTQLSGPSKVDKDGLWQPLPAPIRRVLYLGSLQTSQMEEMMPANPSVLEQLASADAVIYGIGSLYTSICPSLILVVPFSSVHPHLSVSMGLISHYLETVPWTATSFVGLMPCSFRYACSSLKAV